MIADRQASTMAIWTAVLTLLTTVPMVVSGGQDNSSPKPQPADPGASEHEKTSGDEMAEILFSRAHSPHGEFNVFGKLTEMRISEKGPDGRNVTSVRAAAYWLEVSDSSESARVVWVESYGGRTLVSGPISPKCFSVHEHDGLVALTFFVGLSLRFVEIDPLKELNLQEELNSVFEPPALDGPPGSAIRKIAAKGTPGYVPIWWLLPEEERTAARASAAEGPPQVLRVDRKDDHWELDVRLGKWVYRVAKRGKDTDKHQGWVLLDRREDSLGPLLGCEVEFNDGTMGIGG